MRVRPREPGDRPPVEAFLREHHALRVARLGRLLAPLDHPALLAEQDGRLTGVLTYVVTGDQCEILTLHTARRWQGAGTVLLDEAGLVAAGHGCGRLLVITTNDNVDALRFYQRRGFRLAALRPGAVDESRARLKPEIPLVGEYGIPIRDELELERLIVPGMTDDLGPGEEFPQDLSTIFSSYLPPAAGLASQRGEDDLAALLSSGADIEAAFAPHPITSDEGRSFASVDVVLRVPPGGPDVGRKQRRVLVDVLDEVIEGDGYRVRELRVEPSDQGA